MASFGESRDVRGVELTCGFDELMTFHDNRVMVSAPLQRAIYLTGPTASGKTGVGVELARRIDAEVIALDSMTLYRGMDIGTAKPTSDERAEVPHHLIDVLAPWESASVADYRHWAIERATAIEARGRRVLFVGGTPMYLKTLLRGLFEGPGADPALRADLEAEAESQGDPALHARLAAIDPSSAQRLHPNDRRRIIRALEVFSLTGRRLSDLHREHDRPAQGVTVFALERPRAELYARIDARVLAMFREGLVDEVRRLLAAPQPIGEVAAQGVGYRETIALLRGELRESETIRLIQTRTRLCATRQGTWFRGLEEIRPWPFEGDRTAEAIAQAIL
jgi:tRNA dimethylallyltransferase